MERVTDSHKAIIHHHREEGPEFKQPCAGSKMAAGKAGDRWSLPGAEMEKWGKGKNKYHHSQKFKNKPKNLKDKQLASEVPPASRAFQGKTALQAWEDNP